MNRTECEKKVLLKIIFGLSLLFLLSGCAAHPKRTESAPPGPCVRWQPSCTPRVDVLCAVPIDKENLSTMELIDIALRNNPETRVSWNSAKAAAYQLQVTKSTLYPAVNAEAGYALTYQNFSGDGKDLAGGLVVVEDPSLEDPTALIDPSAGIAIGDFIGTSADFSQLVVSNLSSSYLLFDFGARCASIETARQALQVANWSHNRVIQDVMMRVLTSYYAYLEVKALLEAQNEDLKDAEMNLKAATEMFDSGIRTRLDVLQAQSLLVNIQLKMEETRGFVQIEMGNLANALGLPANTLLRVASLPADLVQDEKLESVENLMELAKQRRPDLAAGLAAYKKRQAEYCFAKADGMPFLTANGSLQRVEGISSSVASGFLYSNTVSIEMPLFQGYYYTNRKRVAKAKVAGAYADLQSKESDVLLEVWKSYYIFKTAVKTYKYSEEFLKYTEETYEAALGGYKEGTNCILDLLSAQKLLSHARAEKIQARTQWVTSLAGIAYATGTL